MKFESLNDENFMLYVMKTYDNPLCKSMDEFNEDMNRVKYIKRLLNRYDKKKILKERLILNHIIILNNVFGNEACCRILFFKVCSSLHPYLKSFLDYLEILPNEIPEVNLKMIPNDHKVLRILMELK